MIEAKNVLTGEVNVATQYVLPDLEELEVKSNELRQVITPSKDGFSKVTVNPISLQDKTINVKGNQNIYVHPDENFDALAFVNVIATVDTETKEVTPTKEVQTINRSEGKYIDSVTVNPIPDNYIEPTGEMEITENGNYDVTDKASVKVETSGADMSEYYTETISGGSSLKGGWQNTIKKLPNFKIDGTICSYMFLEYPASILDVSKLDTTGATNMGAMFSGCKNVIELDVSNFDTNQVTNMNSMFLNCQSLQEINIKNFNTSKVTSFGKMFQYCRSLTELDLSGLNTSLVNNMSNMFDGANSLVTLNMNNLDMSKVTNVSYMFSSASKLTNLQFGYNLGKAYNLQSTGYSNYKLDLSSCTLLTHDSLMSVINGLYDLNLTWDVANGGTLYKQSLVLGATNLAKLTEEEIAIATNKGWTLS